MSSPKFKIILFITAFFLSGFFFAGNSLSTDGNLIIGITVPTISSSTGSEGGGGQPPAPTDNPPVISGVSTSTSYTTADVSWIATDDNSISGVTFEYGISSSYGNIGTVTGNYQVNLTGLSQDTVYYFKISVIDSASQVTNYTGTVKTLSPAQQPPNISGVQVSVGMTTATINWSTDKQADSQINYGQTVGYGSTFSDINQVLSHSALLLNLLPDTTYHYRIISTDSFGNSTSTPDATFTTSKDNIPPPDVSGFQLATTSNSINLSWENPSLMGVPDFSGVKILRKIGSPSVNNHDGTSVYTGAGESFSDSNVSKDTNYFYTIFSFDTSDNYSPGIYRNGSIPTTLPPPQNEICGNGLDDDNNGLTDCSDPVCAGLLACQNILPPPTTTPPTTTTPPENPPYTPPATTVPNFAKISLKDLSFLTGNRQILLVPSANVVTGLPGQTLSLVVPEKILASMPKSMIVKIGGTDQHQFVFDSGSKSYYSDFSFPNSGQVQAFLEVDYGSGQFDSVEFTLKSETAGMVVDDSGKALSGVEIILYKKDGSRMPMESYGQVNPFTTVSDGSFGWIVPNGEYSAVVQMEGYYKNSLSGVLVNNNIFNPRIKLIKQPPKLIDVIEPNAPLIKNITNVAQNLVEQTKAISEVTVQKINEAVQSPAVQQTNQQVVVPTAIAVVAVGAIPLISWMDLLPLLRLLFLQPLLLVGRKKREKWGQVYNSLSKLPVDLAIVRLINVESNKLVQSKVTDAQGHYIFIVDPGKYKIEVTKNSYVFPSAFLAGFTSDGQKVDIYHGEVIEVTENGAAIAANIPLDPVGEHKRPSRLVWESFGRKLQAVLSWVGLIVTAVSLYISPKWYIAALLAVHVVLFFLFRRLAMPPKSKSWGIVYDGTSKQPVGRVITRLFNSQFNKLVATQITDNKGRYSFLAGDDSYYVTYEHKDYEPHKTENIDLHGKNSEAIAPDVELKKH